MDSLRVLMITSEWPTAELPNSAPFIVRQVEFLRRAGVDVDVFHFRGAKNPLNYLQAWRRARHRLANNSYDLVHAQWGQSALLALPKTLPLVVTFRGDDLLGIVGDDGRYICAGWILRRLSQLVALCADAVILVAEHMRRYMPPSVPVHVIPSGVDFEAFQCVSQDESRRRLGLPLSKRLILFVGNPAEVRKRYWLAQRAVEILNTSVRARLVVAWDVARRDIPVFMNACDALVFTSMHEGSPNVVKEALACNLPVVSVPVGDVGVRLKGIDGCEVCVDDRPETIAESLKRVVRRGKMIESRIGVENLDERSLTETLISVYRSV